MTPDLPKTYDPAELGARVWPLWEESGAFHPQAAGDGPAYCITIPPPNVTGELHMGHALQHTIHDLLVRRRRMQGFRTLCLPGTDHAGIGTQAKVEQALHAEGTDRRALGRAGFVERSREWTLRYGGAILGQLRALGCSYDYDRLRFTLDEFLGEPDPRPDWALGRLYTRSGYARAVAASFLHFHERGWVYRGERIVNWCPHCRTVVSDLEVRHRDVAARLWYLRYPGEDGGEGLTVATTRPETMLGDTGVAVSGSDPRYADLVGRRVILPLLDRPIPVVEDHAVDPAFGSGAVKVTPAHDPNDWEIASRHSELLPPIPVIGDDGVMTGAAGPYAGLPREEARRRVLADLECRGLLVKEEPLTHAVGCHDRCDTVIEPLLKLQWWVDCRELAGKALAAIRGGRVRFVPERFAGMVCDWLEGIRPWCVSRQLWWGHRIPYYYCLECDPGLGRDAEGRLEVGESARPIPSADPPGCCPRCGSTHLEQDPDVLDTWFSSALWPIATLGWPERTENLAAFYPTDLMITGRDILYLWVARMIMTGEEFLGAEPFREVLVHATVMTEEGRRMSKSLGTGADPLDLIDLYGPDAVRFGLTSLVSESQDIRFKMQWASGGKTATGPHDRLARAEQIEQMRNLCTKLWNISRFAFMNLGEGAEPLRRLEEGAPGGSLELADRWILSRFAAAEETVNAYLDAYELGAACWTLYHFLWDEFADWYVELVKPRLRGEGAAAARAVLASVLEGLLRLAHPFLPFVTEALWQALPGRPAGAMLMTAPYPAGLQSFRDAGAELQMERVIEVTRALRNLKAEWGVPMQRVDASLTGADDLPGHYVEIAARVRLRPAAGEVAPQATTAGVGIRLHLEGSVDVAAERARAASELAALEKELASVRGKLGNEQFLSRAPAEVVEKQRRIEAELVEREVRLRERLAALAG